MTQIIPFKLPSTPFPIIFIRKEDMPQKTYFKRARTIYLTEQNKMLIFAQQSVKVYIYIGWDISVVSRNFVIAAEEVRKSHLLHAKRVICESVQQNGS